MQGVQPIEMIFIYFNTNILYLTMINNISLAEMKKRFDELMLSKTVKQ